MNVREKAEDLDEQLMKFVTELAEGSKRARTVTSSLERKKLIERAWAIQNARLEKPDYDGRKDGWGAYLQALSKR